MGPNFRSAASPLLQDVIEGATREVPQAGRKDGWMVHDAWKGMKDDVSFGTLGGGSDHVAFYCHLGIPSCSLGAGGSKGVSYHSAYDTLAWYRKVVGDDYESALMLTRVGNVLAARLACAPFIPYSPWRYFSHVEAELRALVAKHPAWDLDDMPQGQAAQGPCVVPRTRMGRTSCAGSPGRASRSAQVPRP